MNARNAAREFRRARARRNALANRIAGLVAAGRAPDPRIVAEWESASARYESLDRSTRSTPTQNQP